MGNGELLVLKDLNVWYTKGKPVLEHFSVELGNKIGRASCRERV